MACGNGSFRLLLVVGFAVTVPGRHAEAACKVAKRRQLRVRYASLKRKLGGRKLQFPFPVRQKCTGRKVQGKPFAGTQAKRKAKVESLPVCILNLSFVLRFSSCPACP